MQLEEMDRYRDAYALVRRGLRVTIISALTGLRPHYIQKMWQEVHGVSSIKGQLPASVHAFIKSLEGAAKVSGYTAFALSKGIEQGAVEQALTAKALLKSVEEYEWLAGLSIDINLAYFALRDVVTRIVEWRRCAFCGAGHMYSLASISLRGCPFCRLLDEHRKAA